MQKKTKQIIETAIKLENDGIKFYTDASNKTIHPLGKAVFKSFIEEEKKHLKKLQGISSDIKTEDISTETETGETMERLKKMFQKMYAGGDVVVEPSIDDLKAVKTAIDFEMDGNKIYTEAASSATNQAEKDLFTFLATEEDAHLTVLKNMYDHLERTYKQGARDEQRSQIEWERKLFMRADAQQRRI